MWDGIKFNKNVFQSFCQLLFLDPLHFCICLFTYLHLKIIWLIKFGRSHFCTCAQCILTVPFLLLQSMPTFLLPTNLYLQCLSIRVVLWSTRMYQGHLCNCGFAAMLWGLEGSVVGARRKMEIFPVPEPILQRLRVARSPSCFFVWLLVEVRCGFNAANRSSYELIIVVVVFSLKNGVSETFFSNFLDLCHTVP